MVDMASANRLTSRRNGGAAALVDQRVAAFIRGVADLVSAASVRHRRVLE